MPWPVSVTTISMPALVRRDRISTRPPAGVNLIALERRFQTTCFNRSGSADTVAASGSSSVTKEICFASAAGRTTSNAAMITFEGSTSRISNRSVPDTMRAVSSKSCKLALRTNLPLYGLERSRLRSAVQRAANEHVGPAADRIQGSTQLMETTARNSSFNRLADSACSRAACSNEELFALSFGLFTLITRARV